MDALQGGLRREGCQCNGRFWWLARMNKSGFDAGADHISTGLGRVTSVVSSVKANPKQALWKQLDLLVCQGK